MLQISLNYSSNLIESAGQAIEALSGYKDRLTQLWNSSLVQKALCSGMLSYSVKTAAEEALHNRSASAGAAAAFILDGIRINPGDYIPDSSVQAIANVGNLLGYGLSVKAEREAQASSQNSDKLEYVKSLMRQVQYSGSAFSSAVLAASASGIPLSSEFSELGAMAGTISTVLLVTSTSCALVSFCKNRGKAAKPMRSKAVIQRGKVVKALYREAVKAKAAGLVK